MFGGDIRLRSSEPEILDGPGVADDLRERCYDDLARMHRWLLSSTRLTCKTESSR